MNRLVLAAAAVLGLAQAPAIAADFATAQEARALLVRAINEVRINQTAALAKFNKGDNGYIDRDLYVFCFDGATGSTVAHIDKGRIGRDVRELSDSTGNAFGWALFRDSRQNQIKTFEYLWPHPGTSTPAPKVSFTSRIGGLVCGVGYYK
jgi:signal transduction histidine kinase